MQKIFNPILIFFLAFTFSFTVLASDKITYKVTRVIDGDTLEATDGNIFFRVRLAAVDAPEKAQAYGKNAKYILTKLVLGKDIAIIPIKPSNDKYNRILGIVKLGDVDISLTLIEHGLAHYYRPTCKDWPADLEKYNYDVRSYFEAELAAKNERLGLWSQKNVTAPCEWRHKKKQTAHLK